MSAYTEKEADEKWCPHVRRAIIMSDGTLSPGNVTDDVRPSCIGSRCMQWRWLDMKESYEPPGHLGYPRGYCGLAGRP